MHSPPHLSIAVKENRKQPNCWGKQSCLNLDTICVATKIRVDGLDLHMVFPNSNDATAFTCFDLPGVLVHSNDLHKMRGGWQEMKETQLHDDRCPRAEEPLRPCFGS